MDNVVDGPLTGVRVVDLTIWIQGPLAATLLADLGADVIKLERAGGGDFSRALTSVFGVDLRRPDASSLLWEVCNRNKRAITLDLHREQARPVFRRLIERADVFVTNLHPDALAQFAADEPSVRAMNPGIIYARAGGFGDTGPWANDPCQDTVGMAYGGFMFTCANSDGEPYYPPGAMSDVLSGTMLAQGILAALLQRARTGEGQYVSTSQVQSLMWLQSLNIAAPANLGTPLAVSDRKHPANALFNIYPCGDGGWIALGLILPTHWQPFCEAVGLTHLLDDERFRGLGARARNATVLAGEIEAHFRSGARDHWLGLLRARDLWVAPVHRAEELIDDEQVKANGYLLELENGSRTASMPFTLHGHTPRRAPAPDYGAHSEAVLRETGLTEEEILALKVDGAVW